VAPFPASPFGILASASLLAVSIAICALTQRPPASAQVVMATSGIGHGSPLALPPAWAPVPSPLPSPSPSPTTLPTPEPPAENPIIIGYSVAGRPLEVYRYGRGPVSRMLVAGIHGGYEWNTINLARQLMDYVEQSPQVIPPGVTLYILPALNPDGEARAHGALGRANDRAVDLNRNWPAHWDGEWPRGGCWSQLDITAGAYAGSEPETRALLKFLTQNVVDTLINYHSAALGIFPGGSPPDPDSARLAQALAAVSPYPYPPIETGCLYTGTLVDWTSARGTASVDLELSNHHDTDFEINLGILSTFLSWAR